MSELINDKIIDRHIEIEKLIMRVEKIKHDITYDEWYNSLDKLNDDELLGLIELSDEKNDKDFCLIMTSVLLMGLI